MDLQTTDYSYFFLLLAGVLPLVFAGTAKAGVFTREANRNPRDFRTTLTGYRKRAYAAQDNSFEAFPFFAAGVIIAHISSENPDLFWINLLALVHVLARITYGWAYIVDRDGLRSIAWTLGFLAAATLYLI